jgi:hypothetical protein
MNDHLEARCLVQLRSSALYTRSVYRGARVNAEYSFSHRY